MSSQAHFFRKRAEEMREQGKRAPTDAMKSKFEDIAIAYDALAQNSEREAALRKK